LLLSFIHPHTRPLPIGELDAGRLKGAAKPINGVDINAPTKLDLSNRVAVNAGFFT